VIQVAIVRPGPIQGGMVHPYLQRREGSGAGGYPSPDMKVALARTLGVPIFQEQVMQVAILAAGFTPGEADQLRRAMAAWKRKGGLEKYYERIVGGMLASAATTSALPSRSSARSRALANTAFRNRTRPALRCWPMPVPG
jgi:error-prone DNA polymerase